MSTSLRGRGGALARRRRAWCVPLVALSCWLAPSVARAQTEDPEVLFEQGRRFRAEHRDAEALETFQRMYEATHQPRALAQVGLAEGALERWVSAEAHLQGALEQADVWVRRFRPQLEDSLRTIQGHLGSLEVRANVPGAEVWIGDQRWATLPMSAPARVAAGPVRFEVRAEGRVTVAREVTVSAGASAREEVTLEPVPPPVVERPVEPPPRPVEPVEPSVRVGAWRRPLGWGAAGGAGVFFLGAAVAYVVGGETIAAYNDDPTCPGLQQAAQPEVCLGRIRTVDTLQALAVTGVVIGSALAVSSLVFLLTAPPTGTARRARTGVHCQGGPGTLGLACGWAF